MAPGRWFTLFVVGLLVIVAVALYVPAISAMTFPAANSFLPS